MKAAARTFYLNCATSNSPTLAGPRLSTLVAGSVGVLHGSRSYVLQDEHGQVIETHSISAGLDYPSVDPEHSYLKETGRPTYVSVTDAPALEGFRLSCETEGIIPVLESSHAIFYAAQLAEILAQRSMIIVNLSGRGDKDMATVATALDITLNVQATA